MPDNSESARHISIALWLALFLLLGLQVLTGFSGSHVVSMMGIDYWVVVLLVGVTLLSIASNLSEVTISPPRVMVGLWLALFLGWGFGDIIYYDYPIGSWPWIGYLVYGLIVGLPLLVIASKRVASLNVVRLTVYAGFLMVFAYYLFALLHDYFWFGMYTRLGIGMFHWSDGFALFETVGRWIEYSDWLAPRLLAYLGLGYLLAKRKGLAYGIAASVIVALADSILDWLVFLPGGGAFEAAPLLVVLEYDWIAILRALLTQVSILTFLALMGATATRVRWPFVSLTKPQHPHVRHVRRVAARHRLGFRP